MADTYTDLYTDTYGPAAVASGWTFLVEVAFATQPMSTSPTWTDITAWVLGRDGIIRTWGRPDEFGDVQPGTLSLQLNNTDGRFTRGNTASPYYPGVRNGRRIRVTMTRNAVSYVRFDGHVNEWPTTWPVGGGGWSEATITATDRLKRFGEVGELRSMVEEEILRDTRSTSTDPFTQLIPQSDSDFEAGLGNWVVGGGGSAAASTAQAHQGSGSMRLTADGTGGLFVKNDGNSFAGAAAVTPGDVLSISGWVYPGATTATPTHAGNSIGSPQQCVNRRVIADGSGYLHELGGNTNSPSATTIKALGLNADQTAGQVTADLDHLQSIGMQQLWVVADISWAFPTNTTFDAGVAAKYDEVINQAYARGIPIILQAQGNPAWNVTAGGHTPPGHPWHGPDNATERGNWVTMLHNFINRYGSSKIKHVGVWNEPNIVEFWAQGPSADQYARLLQACYVDIKATWPTIKVDGHQMARNDLGWLAAVYAATDTAFTAGTAAANSYYFDVLGIHPYCGDSTSGYDPTDTSHADEGGFGGGGLDPDYLGYRRLRDAVLAKEGVAKNLAFGEFGYATIGTGWFKVTEAQRATYLTSAIALAAGDGFVEYFNVYYHRVEARTTYANSFNIHGDTAAETAFLNASGSPPGTPPITITNYTTYTGWNQIGGGGNYAQCAWTLRPDMYPGEGAGYYMALQGTLNDNSADLIEGWYAGIQSWSDLPGVGLGRIAIFSIWGAVTATPSNVTGAWAGAFGGEGVGYSVRIPYVWQPGRVYSMRMARDFPRGARWWACYITDTTTGVETWLGSIQTATDVTDISSKQTIQWTELYDPHPDNPLTCQQLPYFKGWHGPPTFSTNVNRAWRVVLRYLNSSNVYVTQDDGPATPEQVGAWTELRYENRVVPSGVAKVLGQVETTDVAGNGEVHYVDDVYVTRAASPATVAGVAAAYYPLSEPSGATTAGNVTTSPQGAASIVQVGTGGTLEFGQGIGPGTDDLSAPEWLTSDANVGQHLRATLLTPVGGGGQLTLEAFYRPLVSTSRTIAVLETAQGGRQELTIDAAGRLRGGSYGVHGTLALQLNTPTAVNDERTRYAALVLAQVGGTVTARLYSYQADGGVLSGGLVAVGSYSTSNLAGGLGTYRSLRIGGQKGGQAYNGTIAHVAATSAALSATRIATHASAGLIGLAGERTDQRLARLADYLAIPTADRAFDTGASTVAAQSTSAKQPLEAMREVERAESGVLYVRGDGKLTFHNRTRRYNQTPAVTLTSAQVLLELEFPGDDALMVNDMTVTRPDGAGGRAVDQTSIDEFNLYRDSLEIPAASDAAALAVAQWRVGNYGTPRDRIPNVTVELARLEEIAPSQVALLLAADISTKLRLTGLPTQAPTSTVDLFVEGGTEQILPYSWRISFNTSPADYQQVWQLGVAGFSELGTTTRAAL